MTTRPLTSRQHEVMQLLVTGKNRKQIAGIMGLSEHSVKFHALKAYARLGAQGGLHAAAIYVRTHEAANAS